jgi:hypothetical protein
MENKNTRIPKYDREPSRRGFKKALWGSMIFIALYGGFLIWKNYYKPGVKPPLERKQLSVPSYFEEDSTTSKKANN